MSLVPGGYGVEYATKLDQLLGLDKLIVGRGWVGLEGIPINVTFLVFASFGTVGNIVNR